jgi:hypothetical protein
VCSKTPSCTGSPRSGATAGPGRVADRDTLQRLAKAYEAKYGSDWHFDVGDGVCGTGEDAAAAFRIEPAKVLALAKQPHAQTTYRFSDR